MLGAGHRKRAAGRRIPTEDAMRRQLSITRSFALVLLLCGAGHAQAEEFRGWVYNGLTGWGSASRSGFDDSALASNPSLGYRWGNLGVEVGHAWFATFDDSQGSGADALDARLRMKGWTLGLDFNHDLAERWALQGRAGVFHWSGDGSLDDGVAPAVDFKDSGDDWYAGASLEWRWRKRTSLGLGYTHYRAGETDIDVWGIASEHRFGGK
jgi:OOP family OmpA-OmpF porin